eukprot:1160921-Pelagomonas_calceolata.AAC.7
MEPNVCQKSSRPLTFQGTLSDSTRAKQGGERQSSTLTVHLHALCEDGCRESEVPAASPLLCLTHPGTKYVQAAWHYMDMHVDDKESKEEGRTLHCTGAMGRGDRLRKGTEANFVEHSAHKQQKKSALNSLVNGALRGMIWHEQAFTDKHQEKGKEMLSFSPLPGHGRAVLYVVFAMPGKSACGRAHTRMDTNTHSLPSPPPPPPAHPPVHHPRHLVKPKLIAVAQESGAPLMEQSSFLNSPPLLLLLLLLSLLPQLDSTACFPAHTHTHTHTHTPPIPATSPTKHTHLSAILAVCVAPAPAAPPAPAPPPTSAVFTGSAIRFTWPLGQALPKIAFTPRQRFCACMCVLHAISSTFALSSIRMQELAWSACSVHVPEGELELPLLLLLAWMQVLVRLHAC